MVEQAMKLPMEAAGLIPHARSMLMIDVLVECSKEEAMARLTVTLDNPFVNTEGKLDSVALLEMMAQTAAAKKGFEDLAAGSAIKKGFLVGMRQAKMAGACRTGDELEVRVRNAGEFGGFSIVEAEVLRDGERLAAGSLKLWVVDDDEAPLLG